MRPFLASTFLALLTLCHAHQQHVFQQPEAGEPADTAPSRRPLVWSHINVISTTDTHGWLRGHLGHGEPENQYSGDWGDLLSFVLGMKQKAREKQVDLLLIDSGDTVDGNGLVDADPGVKGSAARELFLEMPYDLLTMGNHELYNYTVALDVYERFIPKWHGRYLGSNVDIVVDGQRMPFGARFRRWTTGQGLHVLSFGVIFDFKLPDKGLFVQSPREMVQEKWFLDELRRHEPIDVFVIVGHMPAYDLGWRAVIRTIRRFHAETPILAFGGHAHVRDCKRLDRGLLVASGRYMETVGFVSANLSDWQPFRRFLDQNRQTYKEHLGCANDACLDTTAGRNITSKLTALAKQFELSRVLGHAPRSYYLNRYPYSHPASLSGLLTQEVFPKMIRNETRPHPPLMIVNTGSTRFDIFEGPFTTDSELLVLPFLNRNVFIRDVPRKLAAILVQNLHGEPGDEDARSSGFTHREAAAEAFETVAVTNKRLPYGYVTLDSCDEAGGLPDDTPHRPLPAYKLPEYVATELPEGDVVDVAFFDFIGPVITRTLNRLQSERVYSAADIEPYSDMHSNVILGEYARQYWQEK